MFWQLENKMVQIIQTVKVYSNYTTPHDNQKYGQKCLSRR